MESILFFEFLNSIDPIILILSVMGGIAVGLSLGLFGSGGSILAVPLLLYVVGIEEPHVAIGTSALSVASIAIITLVFNIKKKKIHFKEGIQFALPGIGGAIIGSNLGLATPSDYLMVIFAGLMISIAIIMLKKKNNFKTITATTDKNSLVLLHKNKILLTGLLAGLASGYFGIGGGFLIVPSLMYSASIPIHAAIATSMIPVSGFGLTTAISYITAGQTNFLISIFFIIGGIIGSGTGTKIAERYSSSTLLKGFAIVLISVAGYIVIHTLFL
jgi:uncharacterized membrane protein YfcA